MADENMSEVAAASGGVTRRQVLVGAAAGGAALIVTALGATQLGTLDSARTEVEAELKKLRDLVALYDQLEHVGLDNILATGMNIIRGSLDAVKAGVRLLRDGIAAAEAALKNFQALLDALRGAANGAAKVLDDLGNKFHAAESVVVAVLGTALPLAESIAGFFNSLLQKIPFGIGDDIRRAVNALIDLIRAIPGAIDALTTQLLKPLRDSFFPSTGDPAVKQTLIDPIRQNLLAPLDKFLSDVENMVTRWEKDFAKPVQSALDERQTIRKEIAEFKKQNGLA